ncbi:MAG: hypothetical protein ACRD3V_18895, partial [Vicinamibacteria bacterium]
VEGLSYLRGHGDVLFMTLQKAAFTLFVAGGYEVILVALARDVYTIGEGGGIGLGILYAAVGVGSGLGPILARAITGDEARPMRIAIGLSYLAMAAGLLVLAALPSFGLAFLGAMIRAMGGGTLWVFTTQLLLQAVPPEVRGRVFATEYALLTLSMATSAALSGLALEHVGLRPEELLRVMALVTLVPGFFWWLWLLRSARRRANS